MSDTIGAFHGLVPLVDIDVLKHRDLTTDLHAAKWRAQGEVDLYLYHF